MGLSALLLLMWRWCLRGKIRQNAAEIGTSSLKRHEVGKSWRLHQTRGCSDPVLTTIAHRWMRRSAEQIDAGGAQSGRATPTRARNERCKDLSSQHLVDKRRLVCMGIG